MRRFQRQRIGRAYQSCPFEITQRGERCSIEFELLPPDAPFYFIFQSKNPPHLIKVAELDELALEIGRERNAFAREVFRDCTESGVWPDYGDDIETISLPAYEVRRHNEWMFS